MCRLLVFKGTEPIQLSHLLTRPAHSIINQAFDSRLRIDRTRPINGDGFGVGWYDSVPDPELGQEPCIFTSVTPAWNNVNLHRIAEKIKSPLVLMHNGQISEFHKIKRRLLRALPEPLFLFPQGHTDSEFAFALFLSHLRDPLMKDDFTCNELKEAMLRTIEDINRWSKEAGIEQPSLMNFCVTDGKSIVCTRYISSRTDEAASLYFSTGTSFYERSPGSYRMVKADRRQKIVVVASEPLTFEKADWMEIESNTIVCITPNMNVLQYPILDEYHVRSTTAPRNPEFAMRAGFSSNTTVMSSIIESAGPEKTLLMERQDADETPCPQQVAAV
ncbi:glutamine amidotransferase subunit [Malassezia cuniculi]|uniref:Glutamine amidotransferase subunit n=1 Tax=Malassezia cuniculi TaxID=948313 RepID=A0AAF0J6N5_9BASI|nr:glutamine amidotransferase subunit [Malassezia cuniculi]